MAGVVVAIIVIIILAVIGYRLYTTVLQSPYSRAEKHEEAGDIDGAIEEYKREIERNRTNMLAYYRLAELSEKRGLIKQAKKNFTHLVGHTKEIPNLSEEDLLDKLGDLSVRTNDDENAVRYYAALLDKKKNHGVALKHIGRVFLSQGDYSFAISYLERARKQSQLDMDILKWLGYCYYCENNYKTATTYFETVQKSGATSLDLFYALLFSLIKGEMYTRANEAGEFLVREDLGTPFLFHVHRIYIYTAFKMGDYDALLTRLGEARSYLKNIDDIDSDIALSIDSGFYNYFMGNLERALELFQNAQNFDYPYKDLARIIVYIEKMQKLVKTNAKRKGRLTKQEMSKKGFFISVDEEKEWEEIIVRWEESIVATESVLEFGELKPRKQFDVNKVISGERVQALIAEKQHREAAASVKETKHDVSLERLYAYSLKDFSGICANIVKKKLGFTTLQEIHSQNVSTFIEGDGVDFVCYNNNTLAAEGNVMVSFRRWKAEKIGEIAIRDYLGMLEEEGLHEGYLIITNELTQSAQRLIPNLENITVYDKYDFADLLEGEKIAGA